MLPLLQLLLPNVAGQECSAVGIHPIGEVLAGQADPRALPALQLPLIHKAPLLHAASFKYRRTSAVGMLGSSGSSAELRPGRARREGVAFFSNLGGSAAYCFGLNQLAALEQQSVAVRQI